MQTTHTRSLARANTPRNCRRSNFPFIYFLFHSEAPESESLDIHQQSASHQCFSFVDCARGLRCRKTSGAQHVVTAVWVLVVPPRVSIPSRTSPTYAVDTHVRRDHNAIYLQVYYYIYPSCTFCLFLGLCQRCDFFFALSFTLACSLTARSAFSHELLIVTRSVKRQGFKNNIQLQARWLASHWMATAFKLHFAEVPSARLAL